MSFTNFQKTIALTSGVLVLSIAIALVVLAWTGPTANPPAGNADAPINVGSDAQTKAGDLTVSALTTSGGKLYLNNSGFEGDIERADRIIGHNDLQLRSDLLRKTEIFLDDGNQGIKLKHQGTDVLVVGDDDAVHLPGLTTAPDFAGCFLELDENGKVKCYTGGGIPGGDVLSTTQVEVLYVDSIEGKIKICDSHTVLGGDVEKVVRVHANLIPTWSDVEFWFYINGVEQWYKYCDTAVCGIYNTSKYYHVVPGDTLEVCVKDGSTGVLEVSGKIYTLGAKRADITHAFCEEPKILYWYDQAVIGEMSPAGAHYIGGNPAPSVIISAKDEVEVKWIID